MGRGNAKLAKTIGTFSLPAGWTCPMAHLCMSKADRKTGAIADGKHTQFRCFAASAEAAFPSVRESRWDNLDALKGQNATAMAELIQASLPEDITHLRIHVSGDFFSADYLRAWMHVARANPSIVFYGYTKRIALLAQYRLQFPANLRLVASYGGSEDSLIARHGLKSSRVVFSEAEAQSLGLPLDHDDSRAYAPDNASFALLLHGTQPAGTDAADAWKVIKAAGKGYGKRKPAALALAA